MATFFCFLGELIVIVFLFWLVCVRLANWVIVYVLREWLDDDTYKKTDDLMEKAERSRKAKSQRVVGNTERGLIFLGLVLQRWEVLAVVGAYKAVYKFGDIDSDKTDKNHHSFFVGSLLSMAFAIGFYLMYVGFAKSGVLTQTPLVLKCRT